MVTNLRPTYSGKSQLRRYAIASDLGTGPSERKSKAWSRHSRDDLFSGTPCSRVIVNCGIISFEDSEVVMGLGVGRIHGGRKENLRASVAQF